MTETLANLMAYSLVVVAAIYGTCYQKPHHGKQTVIFGTNFS